MRFSHTIKFLTKIVAASALTGMLIFALQADSHILFRTAAKVRDVQVVILKDMSVSSLSLTFVIFKCPVPSSNSSAYV